MRKAKSKTKYWIQSALAKYRNGSLSRQLGIPEKDNIPITLLRKIKEADIGETIHNPTTKGKKWLKATRLLKRRAVLAMTLKRLKR